MDEGEGRELMMGFDYNRQATREPHPLYDDFIRRLSHDSLELREAHATLGLIGTSGL